MSEVINNREYRQNILKGLIQDLHNGVSMEIVKPRFQKLIRGISPVEISEMEQSLIMEGMPLGEVQRLCDVHASLFKGSIEDIHKEKKPEESPGHPVHTFMLENREIETLINGKIKNHLHVFKNSNDKDIVYRLLDDFNLLLDVKKHYSRKKNLLFPYLEKYGITTPPKVMWAKDDEAISLIQEARSLIEIFNEDKEETINKLQEAINTVNEMIFKEENILFPMAVETLSEDEWLKIEEESDDIGYCLTEPLGKWKPARVNIEQKEDTVNRVASNNGKVK